MRTLQHMVREEGIASMRQVLNFYHYKQSITNKNSIKLNINIY